MANIFDLFKQIEKKSDTSPIEFAIVALGNPGEKYTFTRHNAGFLAMDYLCQKFSVKCDKSKFKALIGEMTIGGKRAVLVKPQTFMNNSGEAVREVSAFYKIPPEKVIVIFDDISLEIGKLRVRKNGSAGGHNGIKSIISCIGSDNFPRIKLGVGAKPSPDYDLADWVLGRIPKESEKTFFAVLEAVPDIIELMVNSKFDEAMCEYNGKSFK